MLSTYAISRNVFYLLRSVMLCLLTNGFLFLCTSNSYVFSIGLILRLSLFTFIAETELYLIGMDWK